MKFEINIDEKELADLASQMIVRQILSESYSREKREAEWGIRDGVDKAIKSYIYTKKDEIIERVVERASIEIVKKGLPKFFDKLKENLK